MLHRFNSYQLDSCISVKNGSASWYNNSELESDSRYMLLWATRKMKRSVTLNRHRACGWLQQWRSVCLKSCCHTKTQSSGSSGEKEQIGRQNFVELPAYYSRTAVSLRTRQTVVLLSMMMRRSRKWLRRISKNQEQRETSVSSQHTDVEQQVKHASYFSSRSYSESLEPQVWSNDHSHVSCAFDLYSGQFSEMSKLNRFFWSDEYFFINHRYRRCWKAISSDIAEKV